VQCPRKTGRPKPAWEAHLYHTKKYSPEFEDTHPKFQEPSLPGPYIYIHTILVMDFVLLASPLLIFNYPTKVASLSLSLSL
jgi:hypothetical protein